ncbi:hypothetical protein [Streptomyces sp. NBC_01508]|uniref:hypothetical protein n=1 Tax=Streptomyces sp. NBC_01508 TaxID=2903888 RepID=UPI003864E2B5
MSAPDQEEVTETPESRPESELESKRDPKPKPKPEAEGEAEPAAGPDPAADFAADDPGDTAPGDTDHDDSALTPRQARRIRVAVASVLLVTMAALLAVRLANRSSVLVVGLYGLAMILCGVVIELSRHGRTRLATWLLGVGLAAALATDWLLLP